MRALTCRGHRSHGHSQEQLRRAQSVVKIHAERSIDVVDEGFDVLLRTLVRGNDGKSRAAAAEALVDALVVVRGRTAVAKSRDHDISAARE